MPEEGKKRSHPESGLVPGASRGERGPIAGGAFGGSNRALLERVSDMVTVSDREGRIVYANPATERVSGYAPEEFAALHPFDSMHPEDRPRCEEAFEKLRNTPGLSLDLEHRFRHKDGSWRWAQGTFEGLFDDPEIGGLVATVRDVTEKKRAEAGLRDSEAKYRTLFDSIDEGFCVFQLVYDETGRTVDYRFLEVNRVFERQTGLDDAVGKLGSEIAPNTESHWLKIYDKVARTGQPQRIENYNQATGRWYEAYASRIGGEGSRQVCTVFDDITERKRRELNAALLDEIGKDLARLSAPDEIMETVGARVGAFLGVSNCLFLDVDETRGEPTIDHSWTNQDVPIIKQTFRIEDYVSEEFARANRAGEAFIIRDTARDEISDAENYASLKVGSFVTVPFHWRGRWTACTAVSTVGPRDWRPDEIELLREISNRLFPRLERARAEEALRESEERYRTLVENIGGHAVFMLDADGCVAEWTESAERVMGYSAEEVIGRHVSVFYAPEEVEAGEPGRELAEATREGRAEREGEQVRKDGRRLWVGEVATAVRDGVGNLVGFTKIARDLTERRELEEERKHSRARELTSLAEAAERERISRELHDRVAHQSLELFVALREASPERAAERLSLARETTRRALDQTRALSAELKRLQDEELEEGLEAAFGKLADSYVPDGTEMNVSFSGEESAVPGPVGTQAYLAMREAVRNAVRHSGCSRIGLTLEVVDGELHGLVEDDGEGFDQEAVAKATPSWGVGLRSMRERAEILGGSLRVNSEPGAGTRVELRVPLNGRSP